MAQSQQRRRFLVGFALFAALPLMGCTDTARLYNLRTGAVIHLDYTDIGTGHGKVTGVMPDGTKLVGEYSTISGISTTFSSGNAETSGPAGYSWATAQGFSFSVPGVQYGTATLAGGGEVIQAVYAVDPMTGNGHGVAKDNHGNTYSLQF